MLKYFYCLKPGKPGSHYNLISVVEQSFWNEKRHLNTDEDGVAIAIHGAFAILGGYEYMYGMFKIPATVSEEELVKVMRSYNIDFEANLNI